mgnify:CR=1 FL=1
MDKQIHNHFYLYKKDRRIMLDLIADLFLNEDTWLFMPSEISGEIDNAEEIVLSEEQSTEGC